MGLCCMRQPSYCLQLSFMEPNLADFKHNARDPACPHPKLPDRVLHVLDFASIPLAIIQGHYRAARREALRYIPELVQPVGVLECVSIRCHSSIMLQGLEESEAVAAWWWGRAAG